jgi:hypothetical protein
MADWPLKGDVSRLSAHGHVHASTAGVTVSTTTQHVKGAWTEIISATPVAADGLLFFDFNGSSANERLWDLAIGASGSEKIVVPNLHCSGRESNIGDHAYLPVAIPAGSRIAARFQITGANITRDCAVVLFKGGFQTLSAYQRIEACGIDLTNSKGTVIDPGATEHTKGAWTQLIAATAFAYKALLVSIGHNNNITRSTYQWFLDIAIGGSGAEKILLPDVVLTAAIVMDNPLPQKIGPLPISIPAGSRLAARAQSNTSSSPGRLFTVALYGIG